MQRQCYTMSYEAQMTVVSFCNSQCWMEALIYHMLGPLFSPPIATLADFTFPVQFIILDNGQPPPQGFAKICRI